MDARPVLCLLFANGVSRFSNDVAQYANTPFLDYFCLYMNRMNIFVNINKPWMCPEKCSKMFVNWAINKSYTKQYF